ncbi:MAG: hypothetical protein J7M38_10995, partial [Armatimonadetes bacterium]|nr:hypothetical protein [Armatimonadota bacterium]
DDYAALDLAVAHERLTALPDAAALRSTMSASSRAARAAALDDADMVERRAAASGRAVSRSCATARSSAA